jgi:hypothetical protein
MRRNQWPASGGIRTLIDLRIATLSDIARFRHRDPSAFAKILFRHSHQLIDRQVAQFKSGTSARGAAILNREPSKLR